MTRLPATTATSKPSSCSRQRSGLRLLSCCDMERHPLDHVNRLARQQRALRARRRAFAVPAGEADLRSRRRVREGKGDEFLETDGAGADGSEERRVGKESVSTCRSRMSPIHLKKIKL